MTDQLRISDSGEIEAQPLTADGQPLYSQDTVRELFSSEAFKQMRGQMALEVGALYAEDEITGHYYKGTFVQHEDGLWEYEGTGDES